ncbi:MAG TPA: signal peptidase II, partial [Candidatus Methylomirabilis sp.]|nr:signal peptidase II [Candidatus Methylomirabilis sp.]
MNALSFYVIAGAILAADQVTKLAVQQRLLLGHIIPVIPSVFNLTYVLNPGAAFGFLSDAP